MLGQGADQVVQGLAGGPAARHGTAAITPVTVFASTSRSLKRTPYSCSVDFSTLRSGRGHHELVTVEGLHPAVPDVHSSSRAGQGFSF